MCKVGDILLIFNARNKRSVGMHPFIVLDDSDGKVSGVYSYNFMKPFQVLCKHKNGYKINY